MFATAGATRCPHRDSVAKMSSARLLDIDLTAHDLYRDGFPHELFGELRDDHSVWRHRHTELARSPEGIEFWAVLGHPELQAVARDWKTFSSLDGPSISPNDERARAHHRLDGSADAHSHAETHQCRVHAAHDPSARPADRGAHHRSA